MGGLWWCMDLMDCGYWLGLHREEETQVISVRVERINAINIED